MMCNMPVMCYATILDIEVAEKSSCNSVRLMETCDSDLTPHEILVMPQPLQQL